MLFFSHILGGGFIKRLQISMSSEAIGSTPTVVVNFLA
jgi:hypothetical protein